MSTTVIKLKRSETASSAPAVGDLQVGEVAMNVADQIIYTKNSSNQIIQLANYSVAGGAFPTGDYGDFTTTTDAFGQNISVTSFDCLDTPAGQLATTDLGALS